MASIFEEMMTLNHNLTESVNPSLRFNKSKKVKKTESRKISYKNLKVESRRFFEENDIDDLENDFKIPEDESPDQVVLVIDPEAPSDEEIPEDAAADMVGDKVYKCPVCGSNYVCDCTEDGMMEDMEVDEEGNPVECPICGDDADQILIGEITPAEDVTPEDETEMDSVDEEDAENAEEEDDIVNEDLDISVDTDEDGAVSEVTVDEDGETVVDEVVGEESEEETSEDSLDEDLEDGSLELDTPAVEEPVPCEEPEEEEAPAVEVTNSTVTFVFDDSKFESMMTRMIKENYKNKNTSFKVSKVRSKKGQLTIEYVLRSGKKSVKGTLVGEGYNKDSRRMKIKFKDKGAFTESFAKTPSFVVECINVSRKIVPTKMTYDYQVKVNESLYRVTGSVSK